MEKKKSFSLFWKLFLWVLFITFFSNILLSYTIYQGYRGIIWRIKFFLPSDFYEDVEVGIRNTWVLVFVFFFIILFFNVVFVIIFISGILGPFQKLLKGIEEVKKGNLETKVEITTGDELEILAKEFNRMIKELREAKEKLEEEKLVLEIKVKARTKKLEELTERLEKEVEERTKELKKRVEELEKFHQLTIGRELKMIELKTEIEKLREELKKYKIKEEGKSREKE